MHDGDDWRYQIFLKSQDGPVDIYLVSNPPEEEDCRCVRVHILYVCMYVIRMCVCVCVRVCVCV